MKVGHTTLPVVIVVQIWESQSHEFRDKGEVGETVSYLFPSFCLIFRVEWWDCSYSNLSVTVIENWFLMNFRSQCPFFIFFHVFADLFLHTPSVLLHHISLFCSLKIKVRPKASGQHETASTVPLCRLLTSILNSQLFRILKIVKSAQSHWWSTM